ncbi:hypothetical protein HELRODRAFT_185976 [Helobdella robusta]|uniref:Uncharacterized protein n=1 Tax=Helobdella robusta TaxID=6412 RepID=T1FNI2_HELRO|nr:hypothetical protein HELRODRAFT_185976 [Helobdella robusta]ESN95328.1 hypothetical protein HELRODRAFT_185976 [Helobdella robusta]
MILKFFLIFVTLFVISHGHGHSHDGPGAGHGHVHAHHGASHGHAHDHGASHGHAHDHGHAHHDHDHHDESEQKPPSFKYSREANVKDVPVKPVEPQKTAKPKEEHEAHKTVKREDETPVEFNLWMTAIGSTVLISLAPIVILLLIPLDKGPAHENFLKTLLSFASGGLLGDAFLHLIPHALMAHDSTVDIHHDHDHVSSHNHGHSHGDGSSHSHDMRVGLWILSGIVAFLAVEKLVRILKNEKHGHSHSIAASDKKKVEQHGDTKKDVPPKKETKESGIKVAAYLNLAADFTHNFTDGLAIGASYLVSRNVGMITTLTILLHEVPHEIGDFAILIQSGCSKKKAMFLQVATAAGALSGTLCSLMAEGAGELATSWILPFTAGGFIYIATVAVIPELLGDAKLWQSVKEICAMLVGILMMVFIAQIE